MSVRVLAPFLMLLLLSACGFQPVYAKKDAASSSKADSRGALQGVKVLPAPDRQGQLLQIALEDTIYPGNSGNAPVRYLLTATPSVMEWPAVIESNQFVGRFNIRIMVTASLMDAATNKPIWAGNVVRLSSYNAAQADFATYAAKDDAMKRGLKSAAEDLTMQIQAKLSEENPSATTAKKVPKQANGLLPSAAQMQRDGSMSTIAPQPLY